MPLDRPPRPPAGAVTERVRKAILANAQRLCGLDASGLLTLHEQAEHVADRQDLIADLEERYGMPTGSFVGRVWRRHFGESEPQFERDRPEFACGAQGARLVLLELPDSEFLTVIEHAVRLSRLRPQQASDSYEYVGDALRAHGTPYRALGPDWEFEWIGDPAHHVLTVQPALLALADSRLAGARAEFEEALSKRRVGTPKNLEDAVDEAAKSVESILKILHHELGVTPPRSQQVTSLFNSLVTTNKLPGYVDKLIAAASGPRNNMASHGQGATVREVPEELADASIAAAATAITFLARYLR